MNINPGAFKPGGFKPPSRPKASSITEEPVKPTAEDEDDQPIEKNEPTPIVVKKPPVALSDSEDDDLFSNKKKTETSRTSVAEEKPEPNNENQTGRKSVKNIAVKRIVALIISIVVDSIFFSLV